MHISPIINSSVSFTSKYKTEDVLRLLTGYSYRNKATDGMLVSSLTGVDIFSKEFSNSLPKDTQYLFVILSILRECHDQILEQHPELKEADDSFDSKLHLTNGKQAQNEWFKCQLKKLDAVIDIEPFKLDKAKIKERYKDIESVFNSIF